MADLKELGITLLGRVVIADFNAAATHDIYRVPPGKILIPVEVIFHSNGGTLVATATGDVNLGGGADSASPVWVDAFAGFEDMTATGDYYIRRNDGGEFTVIDGDDATEANRVFSITIVTGSDANGVTIDLFGYLIDS